MSGRAQQGEKGSESAARTRPLSIQEILLRREKKALAEAKKAAAEARKAKEELQGKDRGKPNHLEPGRGHKSRKDLKDVPVEGSRKESIRDAAPREDSKKDDVRRTSKEGSKRDSIRDAPREDLKKDDVRRASKEGSKRESIRDAPREDSKKDGSKKESIRDAPREVSKKENLKDRPKDGSKLDDLKDTPKVSRKDDQRDAAKKGSKNERSSVRDDSQSAGKDKDAHNSHKHSTGMRGRPAESIDGNHGEIRARNGDATRSESIKGPGKRWNGEPVHNDRIMERSDKLRNEAKRKTHGFDDEKTSYVDRPVLKKHESARFQVSKHYDRNDARREYGKPYHEEPRSKRRRSRSRDHDQGRRDRSLSLSPREQRRSYHGHDHGNYPPVRKYAENDRHRTSDNVGQRYESRLGGYSPRKRKTVPQDEQLSTTITPPVIRSPEKKPATWDQPPAAADQSNFFTNLQPIVSQTSSVAVSLSTQKQNPATALDTILSGNSSSIDSVQLTQATRPLRRLHIENLNSSASEDMLIGCLNDFLLSSGVNRIQRSKQPCLSCTINKEKRQAFVEFLTPEDATAALSFDGRSFNGSTMKIRRPKEYIEMAHVAQKKTMEEEIKETSDVVADSPDKIFIAGISGVLSSEMLVEIVSSFGQLAAYRFVCNEDLGGRCAFLEYIDHSITKKACAGLNGMKLGGCILTAVQVFPNPLEVHNEASPFYGIPDSAKALLEEPTNVLQLKNVFDREEFLALSKPELEEILEDVRMECARFGAVKSINIVEYAISDSITEDVLVEPKDEPVKLEPTECRANDNFAETGTDCSLPSRSTVVPPNPKEITGAECQDHKELDTLRECDASVAADQYTDLDDIHARAAGPTVDQQTEIDHMDSVQADQDATAVGDIHARAAGPTVDQQMEAGQMDSMPADQDATAVVDIHARVADPTADQQTEAGQMDSMPADQDATAVVDIHARVTDPTADQQTEAGQMDSMQADQDATAVVDIHARAVDPTADQQTEADHMDSMQADQDPVVDIHARAADPTADQQTEAGHMDSTQAGQDATAVVDIHARAVSPTVDQQTEAGHMDSTQADQDATAVGDVQAGAADPMLDQQTEAGLMASTQTDQDAAAVGEDSLGEGHAGPATLEICASTIPGDVVERSETENEQQSANDASESGAEILPVADTRDDAPVSDTIVLEAGSILVEFMRKEAACMAAHSLHGRSFGDRTVSAGYAPHDLYLQRYPR